MSNKTIEERFGEFYRVFRHGTVGAAETKVLLYRCESDEMIEINSFCIENTHVTQTVYARFGVDCGGIFYPHMTDKAIAAVGASMYLRTKLYARETDEVCCYLTGSGADTSYRLSVHGFLHKTR